MNWNIGVQVAVNKSNTDSTMKTVEWKHLNWHKLEKAVFKLQKRIYKASQRGDVKATRRLPLDVDEVLVRKVFSGQTGNPR